MSSDNRKLTDMDNAQILRHQHDEESAAQRVKIVSGEMPEIKVDASAMTEAVKEGFKSINFNNKETRIDIIKIPSLIKEIVIERIEVPVIVKEIEYREIKIPVEIVKIVEIEKPVIIKEIEFKKESTIETKYLRIISLIELFIILALLFKK